MRARGSLAIIAYAFTLIDLALPGGASVSVEFEK